MFDRSDKVEILIHTGMFSDLNNNVRMQDIPGSLERDLLIGPPNRYDPPTIKIDRFLSYSIESDLFTADDAFTISLVDPKFRIEAGMRVDVKVNDIHEMTGIVDRVETRFSKHDGKIITISGRDLMGLLVDSHVETFPTEQNIELKALAALLLKTVPYIKPDLIMFGEGDKKRAAPLKDRREDFEFVQIEPGKTIFETLKEYATARGMLFWCQPNGTLVFGLPKTSGKPDCFLFCKKDFTLVNNIIEGEEIRDISQEYSKITIIGQRQGTDFLEAEHINTKASVENTDFRFRVLYKPFVGTTEYDGQNPEKYARLLMEKQKFEGHTVTYKVAGHSQNGRNYTANSICLVEDEELDIINVPLLIYSRIFEMDTDGGMTTTLKLSSLGVLPT